MPVTKNWQKETGARLAGSRELDSSKLQAPCIVRVPTGGYRLFYTAVGPGKPFPACQGYILSAVSDNGLTFRPEPGIRLAPRPELEYMSLRLLAPTITPCGDYWRMYVESRGSADRPTVICSAVSTDMIHWELENGIRLQTPGGVGGPRYLHLPDGRGRLYCFQREYGADGMGSGPPISTSVISAMTADGLNFTLEPGLRMQDKQTEFDTSGITAAEVIAPQNADDRWTMFYSAWQDVPPGTTVPLHPALDSNAVTSGKSDSFASASIATDMAGYRSRIHVAYSGNGLTWTRAACVIEGDGYEGSRLDAVHAEDMSLIRIGRKKYRMYYAACDRHGVWQIASAVTTDLP